MIGGLLGRPVACSTGPGQPDADAAPRRSRGAPGSSSSAVPRSIAQSARPRGRARCRARRRCSASTAAARSVMRERGRAWRRRRRPARSRAPGLKANWAGGRPPVDAASPARSRRGCWPSRASTRWATVDRASPVIVASSRGCGAGRRAGSGAATPAPVRRWRRPVVRHVSASEPHSFLRSARDHAIVTQLLLDTYAISRQ